MKQKFPLVCVVAIGTFATLGTSARAQEFGASPSISEVPRPDVPMQAEPAGGTPKWIYVGPKGAFHLGSANNATHSRGIFRAASPGGVRYWSNSFQKLNRPDPAYWHYEMVGFHYEVALAKQRSCCCGYAIFVRNPDQCKRWHFFQFATRGKPQGNAD